MVTSLKEVVSKLTTISDESQKVDRYRNESSLCEKALIYVDQLKREGPQAVSQVIQRFVYFCHLALQVINDCLKLLTLHS